MIVHSIDTFDTARMVARRLSAEDYGDLCRMHRDAAVMATLGGVRSDEETQRFVDQELEHWRKYGYGLWILRDRRDAAFIARAGLRTVQIEGVAEVEVAYALMPEFWSQNLATEAARAILKIAFTKLGLAEVVAFTLTTNRASQRVMEKAGMKYARDIVRAGLPHVLYRITAST